jgi:hypothetical protein
MTNIKEENVAQAELCSGGYQNAIFNMLFLLQTRIIKMMRGELMDEELFRSYFVKLYRKMVQMEVSFINLLEGEDKDGFLHYSKSLKDLATSFKSFRDPSTVI